jgi:hypothetical protein
MLQAAIDSEVEEFLQQHQARRDENGRRQVVRSGYLPPARFSPGRKAGGATTAGARPHRG